MKILHGQSIFVCTSCFGLKLILRQKKQRSEEILRLWSGFLKFFFRAVCHVSHLFLFGKTHVIYRMIKYLLLQTQNSSKTTQGFSPGSWGPTEDKVWKIPSSDWAGCVGGRPTFVDTDKRMNVVFVTGFFFFTLQSFVKRRSRNSDQLEAPRRLQRSRVLEKVDVCSLLRSHTCFLGHLQGFSYHAGHVCSWRWRPCNANPPPRLRKVPCLPVQKENNKELSVAAAPASRPRCTSRTRPRVTACSHLSTHDSLLSPPPRFLSSSSTCERNMCVFGRSLDGMARRRRHVLHGHITAVTRCEILKPSATHGLHSVEN